MPSPARAWAAVLAWCALIFAFSCLPGGGPSALREAGAGFWAQFAFSKLCHVGEYAALYWLARRALHAGGRRGRGRELAAFAFCLAYAFSDEWHQSFVFGRTGTCRDVLLDALAAAAMRARLNESEAPGS